MGEVVFLVGLAALLAGGLLERRRRRRREAELGVGHNAHRNAAGDHSPQTNPADHRYQGGISPHA